VGEIAVRDEAKRGPELVRCPRCWMDYPVRQFLIPMENRKYSRRMAGAWYALCERCRDDDTERD